jgi:hypothetical protein
MDESFISKVNQIFRSAKRRIWGYSSIKPFLNSPGLLPAGAPKRLLGRQTQLIQQTANNF